MVKRFAFAVPGDLATPTGGYAYDRRMIAELEHLGWQIDVVDLGEGFPWPSERDAQRRAGAALGRSRRPHHRHRWAGLRRSCPRRRSQLRSRNPLIALVHHPLALESGLSAKQAEQLRASERAALTAASRVIVTSAATARHLIARLWRAGRSHRCRAPGQRSGADGAGSRDGIVRLLSVGAVVPRKGFDVLIAALATLADLPWRLTIAGDRSRDLKTAAQLDADIARFDLGDRVAVLGAVSPERLAELYAGADLFVLASRFEGYGMAYAEAIAHGLPVIGTTAGAIPDTVPAGAGVLVAPDDAAALALALRRLIENPDERRRLAQSARAAARQLPTWQDSAKTILRARSRPSHERLFGGLAGAARALRRARAQSGGSRRRYRCAQRLPLDQDCRSRLRHRIDAARARAPACRRSRTGGLSTTISACWRARSRSTRPADVTVTGDSARSQSRP